MIRSANGSAAARTGLLLLILSAPASAAWASPAYPLEELLTRAETVFIGQRLAGAALSIAPTHVFRGPATATAIAFTLAGDSGPITPGDYLVISQGDARGGPTREIRLGQGTEGQAGYCGWIALPLEHDPKGGLILPSLFTSSMKRGLRLTMAALATLVRRHRYHAN